MSAWLRSNVTVRNESGFGPLSFKRLLFAGGLAAITMMLIGRLLGPMTGCGAGIFASTIALIFSHPTSGLPLIVYLARNLRGLAIVAALRSQVGLFTLALQAKPEDGILQADEIYGSTQACAGQYSADDEWALLPGGMPDTDETGLLPLPSPFGVSEQ